jgi:outer membrane protein assembly factor BamB
MRKNKFHHILKNTFVAASACTLTACSGFFDKDNAPTPNPLVAFKATAYPMQVWKTSAGSGNGKEFLKLNPAMNDGAIFTASVNGTVTSIAKSNGATIWQASTGATLTTGPGVGNNIVVVGSRHGKVVALGERTGSTLWTANVKGELIANPAVKGGKVIIKAIDGTVTALSSKNGHKLWSFHQTEPNLVLRGSSTPLIKNNSVLVGFANGKLANSSLSSGSIRWIKQLATPQGAFAIQRMIDIDADPIIRGNRIYAATYQGKVAALDWQSGSRLWSHKLSSYTGMTADSRKLFISDANSYVWAFGAGSGHVNWRQTELKARNISGPASMGNYIVVGDAEGYLHWLDKSDGHFAAREYVGGGVLAKPLVDHGTLYALTTNGYVAAYKLRA